MNPLLKHKKLLILLGLLNIVAGIYSLQYYFYQFKETNPVFWFFVADCPVYAVLLGFVFLFCAFGTPRKSFSLIAIAGAIKYSIWTVMVLFLMNNIFALPNILVVHLLLIAETFLLLRVFSFKVRNFIIALAWFLFNDVLDYYLLLHPYFDEKLFNTILGATLVLSIVLPFLVSVFFSSRDDLSPLPRAKNQKEFPSRWAKKS